jgi:hypothetical protein
MLLVVTTFPENKPWVTPVLPPRFLVRRAFLFVARGVEANHGKKLVIDCWVRKNDELS